MKTRLFLTAFACTLGLGASLISAAHAQGTELKWYKGNTHTHTSNSSGGDSAPDAVARWYREHGYQFVFITDHDEYLTDVEPLNALLGRRDWFLVLPGQEIGERIRRANGEHVGLHMNALFTTETLYPETSIESAVAPALAQGALVQFNHPNYVWSVKPADLDTVPDGALIEVWNGLDGINNLGGDDGQGDVRPSAEGYWDYLLSRGKIIWGVGADDAHVFKGESATPGRAWIVVRAPELTPDAIKTAMTKGEFYASTGLVLDDIVSDANSLTVKIAESESNPPRYLTRFVGQGGEILAEVAGLNPSYRFRGNETYVRASIIDSNGRRAWTQPVFRDGRAIR
ncbi:CehA/McbA family metallohydrolase [Sphingosinicella sp. CPCC 101087]|uniref:CehA/McbA family metallohydrolase n=1 Tax=Sphingosinicella sp. CPCC 101087 TaxID=2497754 RepID=UPI00101C5EB3|nr:CehA/McbA family metallohydrolase [Sphingosinicella sp. CPCC 101087]